MDIEILSRLQFAFTIAFHYIYPPLSIGLGVALVVFEGMYLRTRDKHWEQLTKFWIKIFALIFAIGLYPNIMLSSIDSANSLTIANSAASSKSLGIILTFVLIGAPLVLIYFVFLFRTFRGKVVLDEMSY